MKFPDLGLAEPILRAVEAEGYDTPTPIQAQTIPHVLEGRDVLGSAQTGTGKTAAFALPLLHRLSTIKSTGNGKQARVLVLCPTRELAGQIADSFKTYGKNLKIYGALVYGGVSQNPQVKALRSGVDVIVATPGRLQDLMEQGHVDLRGIEALVLDEADRMLDMGFITDIRRICEKLPPKRQTLLFSATMPREIRGLADSLLTDPATVTIAPKQPAVEAIEQSVYFVQTKNKPALLAHVLDTTSVNRVLVFTRTKHGADRVVKQLRTVKVKAEAIHGNKTQNARQRALESFKSGRVSVLVATDIASRGIDVDGVSHVINYDVTHEPETYVHRIGRTARAGASGAAISFCAQDEVSNLAAIQRLIRQEIPIRTDCPELALTAAPAMSSGKRSGGGGGGYPRRNRNGYQGGKAAQRSRPRNGGGPRPRGKRGGRSAA